MGWRYVRYIVQSPDAVGMPTVRTEEPCSTHRCPDWAISIAEALKFRQIEGRPVRVGLIGAGPDGHRHHRPDCADGRHRGRRRRRRDHRQRIRRARDRAAPARSNRVLVEGSAAVSRAISRGQLAVVRSHRDVCTAEGVDVVIDATGNPNVGRRGGAGDDRRAGKHIVMMNVEADVTIGAYLAAKAASAGVVYTLGAGDRAERDDGADQFRARSRLSDRRRRQRRRTTRFVSTRRRTRTSRKRHGAT